MSLSRFLYIPLVVVALAACAVARAQQVVPANTPLEIRLTERVSTSLSKPGQTVHAILVAPVLAGEKVVLPLGSKVEGTILRLNSVGLGFGHETSYIGLEMNRILLPGGETVAFSSRVAQIENSREVIDKQGRIAGVRATSTLSHKASGAVGTLALGNPMALIFTTAASSSLLRFSDPEIALPAHAELILLTTQPMTVNYVEESSVPSLVQSPEAQQELHRLIRKQPFRTVTDPKHTPSDITNLMLIGEDAALLRAFQAAGWLEVDSLSAASAYETIRAVSEAKEYRTAPMSTLLLDGEKPAHAMAKTLDTFSKRHHLRIYATADSWESEHVWLSSSTQDIGIGFSTSQKNLIHQIDHNIDHERTKIVNDLLLTGCVTGINLVERSWLPKNPKNGTGEEIVTDGRMAVIRLNRCNAPANVPRPEQTADVPVRSNPFVKTTRQTSLTLRNMLLRDNLAVTAYGGIKVGLGIKHPKPPEQPLETLSVLAQNRYVLRMPASLAEVADPAEAKDLVAAPEAEKGSVVAPVVTKAAKFPPYSVEIGVHGGFAGYAGGNGGAVGYVAVPTDASDPLFVLVVGNEHSNGWNLGGSATLNLRQHFSHEISFDYNRTGFTLGLTALELANSYDTTDSATQADFLFDEVALSTTEVAYNLQYHFRQRESRWRPYIEAGPSLRLMHMTDAPVKKASPWFRLGLSSVGALIAAYRFGSTPPLEGGGLFQPGLQYGAGIKFRASRHVMLRAGYKETLSAQPNFWTNSKNDVLDSSDASDYTLIVVGPELEGAMRQQRVTMGFSFLF